MLLNYKEKNSHLQGFFYAFLFTFSSGKLLLILYCCWLIVNVLVWKNISMSLFHLSLYLLQFPQDPMVLKLAAYLLPVPLIKSPRSWKTSTTSLTSLLLFFLSEKEGKKPRKKALPKFDYFLSVSMGTRTDEGATASHQLDCWNSSQRKLAADEELQASFGLSTGVLNLKFCSVEKQGTASGLKPVKIVFPWDLFKSCEF